MQMATRTKRKPTKAKLPSKSTGTAVLIHLDKNTMGRLKIFQSWFGETHGTSLKNGPAVKLLMTTAMNDWEKQNRQMDLLAVAAKKKKTK